MPRRRRRFPELFVRERIALRCARSPPPALRKISSMQVTSVGRRLRQQQRRSFHGQYPQELDPHSRGAFRNRVVRQFYHYVNWRLSRLSRLSAEVTNPGMILYK